MKLFKRLLVLSLFFIILSIRIAAVDSSDFGIDVKGVTDLIPEEVKEYLSDSSTDDDNVVEIARSVSFSSLSSLVSYLLKESIKPFFKTFSVLLAIIAACSVINAAKNSISDESMVKSISFVTVLVVSVVSYGVLKEVWASVESFMKRMDVVISAMLPIMTLIYTLGGNVATAVVNSSGTAITLSVINTLCQHGLFPVLKTLFGLSLTSSVGGFQGINEISKTVRTIFTVILSGMVTVFSIFMLFKTNLAIASDGVAARTVKFAGSFVPVIGSALGDSVRGLISSLSLIKSSCGLVGIVIVLCATLPILICIITNKICFDLAGGVANMLGCEAEGKIMKEFSSILNFALAITVTISVLFVFELTIFINTSLVLGGS